MGPLFGLVLVCAWLSGGLDLGTGQSALLAKGPGWIVLGPQSVVGGSDPQGQATERRDYSVTWMGLPVVRLTIETSEDEDGRQTSYHARTLRWMAPFYSVDNRYTLTFDASSGELVRYEKVVTERGRTDSLQARYEVHSRKRVLYSNGVERTLPAGSMPLFAALGWVQRYPWRMGEELALLVEVEGVVWKVAVRSAELSANGGVIASNLSQGPGPGGSTVEQSPLGQAGVEIRFVERVGGSPVLARTDVLTRLLPGEGHRVIFGIDLDNREVIWARFGRRPLAVRAELNRRP